MQQLSTCTDYLILATNHPRSSHRGWSRLVTVEVKGQPQWLPRPSPRSPETEVDPAHQRKSFETVLRLVLDNRFVAQLQPPRYRCRSLSRRRWRWRRSGVACRQRQRLSIYLAHCERTVTSSRWRHQDGANRKLICRFGLIPLMSARIPF